MNQQTAWDKEYLRAKGVPTSTRTTPSSAVTRLISYVDQKRPDLGKSAIDLGCGIGRNSIYLADQGYLVTAVDFSVAAIDKFRTRLKGLPEEDRIKLKVLSLADPLPFPDNSFDLAVDCVTTMTLEPDEIADFEQELRRIVKPRGLFLSYVLATDDGFLEATSPGAKSTTVKDSGITDQYFSEDYLRSVYKNWDIKVLDKIEKSDEFYGQMYTRRIWWMLAQNQ